MKSVLCTLLLCVCLAGSGQAFIVSGVVVNASTSKPVSGQKVYVQDTLTHFLDSVVTNASGGYSLHINSGVDTNDLLQIYTYGCGRLSLVNRVFTGGTVVANLNICPTLYSLNGTVSLNGSLNTGLTRLFLVSRAYDSLKMDSVMYVADTLYTDAYGGTYSKGYSAIPSGTLFLKAELMPGNPNYGRYMPSWLGRELVWSQAQALQASNFSASVATPVNLIPALGSSGPAKISGIVQDATPAQQGGPKRLRGRLLLLTQSNGTPIAFTQSDTDGSFSFSQLAFGTYKLFGDAWGKLNPALTFTLTATRPTIFDIVFTEDSNRFSADFGPTYVAFAPDAWAKIRLFPNPSEGLLHSTGLAQMAGAKQVQIRSITGARIRSLEVAPGQELQLDLGTLPAGIFLVEIRADQGCAIYRLSKR